MSLPASRARCLLADQLGVQRRSRAVAAATRMAGFVVVLLLQVQLCPAAIFCGSAGPKLCRGNNLLFGMASSPELQQLKQMHAEANSASCERVFARLKNLFGDEQMSALADYVQAALMLNYNKRLVG